MTLSVRAPVFAYRLDRPDKATTRPAGRLLAWHRTLVEGDRGADRALRAQLKRCQQPGEALLVPGFLTLFESLYPDAEGRQAALQDERVVAALARVAIAAAALDGRGAPVDTTAALALQMLGRAGRVEGGRIQDATVSPLRLRTLINTQDPDAALTRWRRLLPVFAANGVNLPELAQALAHWNEATRRQLSFAYFGFAATGPNQSGAPALNEPDDVPTDA